MSELKMEKFQFSDYTPEQQEEIKKNFAELYNLIMVWYGEDVAELRYNEPYSEALDYQEAVKLWASQMLS